MKVSMKMPVRGLRLWRRTIWGSLFGRLGVILFCGLAAAHALTLFWVFFERAQLGRSMMLAYMGRDIASAVAILDRVPPAERQAWLPRLERQDYRYTLSAPTATPQAESDLARVVRQSVASAVGASRVATKANVRNSDAGEHFELGLVLNDGSPRDRAVGQTPHAHLACDGQSAGVPAAGVGLGDLACRAGCRAPFDAVGRCCGCT